MNRILSIELMIMYALLHYINYSIFWVAYIITAIKTGNSTNLYRNNYRRFGKFRCKKNFVRLILL